MSNNLDYIQELGIGLDDATLTDADMNNTDLESEKDFVQEPEEPTLTDGDSKTDTDKDTVPDMSEELRKQIEGLEKRISDKDEYINTLRDNSKKQEADTQTDNDDTTDDFWDDPEKKFKEMQETMRVQQMQIQETVYANTVDEYWKIVNPEALQKAVATDTDFSKKFNGSNEPYKTAYEYLTKQTKDTEASNLSLRESIKAELIKEMGLEPKKKRSGIPDMSKMGGSNGSKSTVSDDGFAAIFGQ